MKFSGEASCLMLFCLAVSSTLGEVTDQDKDTINKGIQAGKDFAKVLENTNDILKVLGKMNDIIGPWVDGIGVFSSVLGMFLPEDNALLNEMKKGFKEVNKRLDAIKEGLKEVKEAIDWAVVKVNFQGIEQDIRLMDEKLKEVVQAPTPDHGRVEFIRVYENQYNEAGLLLFDAIVHNDQVFYTNIIRAGMEYTKYDRAKMSDFMKGLIVLMMKSSNIEVSYESFKKQDRGMDAIWKNRLNETKEAMEKADKVLEDAWKNLFRGEVDRMSKDMDGWDHVSFRDKVFKFLSEKYGWMYWFVLAYDDVGGFDNHAITHTDSGHHQFRHYGRNFVVAASEPSSYFNIDAAHASIKDIHCPQALLWCMNNSAMSVVQELPWYGVGKVAIRVRAGWACKGMSTRWVTDKMFLHSSTWRRQHHVFYFG